MNYHRCCEKWPLRKIVLETFLKTIQKQIRSKLPKAKIIRKFSLISCLNFFRDFVKNQDLNYSRFSKFFEQNPFFHEILEKMFGSKKNQKISEYFS